MYSSKYTPAERVSTVSEADERVPPREECASRRGGVELESCSVRLMHYSLAVLYAEITHIPRPAILDLITKLENAKVEAEQLRVRLEKGKAKASPDACTEEGEPRSRPNKRRRTSDDEAPSTAKNGVVDLAAEEEEDEDEDAAYPDFVPSSDVEEQAIQDDSIVDCPMGTHETYMEHINVHLDSGCKLHTYELGRRRGTAGKPAPAPSNKNKSASSKSAWNNVFQSNSGTSSRDRGKGKDSRCKLFTNRILLI